MKKLNINSLTSRSAAISLLGAGCASILLVFGIGAAVGQNSNELRSPSEFSATTLRKDHEPPLVIDGPFAETKEQLLGFYIIDCSNLEEALAITKDLGQANPGGAYEIRPVGVFFPGKTLS